MPFVGLVVDRPGDTEKLARLVYAILASGPPAKATGPGTTAIGPGKEQPQGHRAPHLMERIEPNTLPRRLANPDLEGGALQGWRFGEKGERGRGPGGHRESL